MEAYNLPVKLREWFVKRLLKQKEEEAAASKAASKGKSKASSPTRLGADNAAPSMPGPSK